MRIKGLLSRIRSFAKDQGGMEALQAVSLIAIAAVIMITVATGGNAATKWMKSQIESLMGKSVVQEVQDAKSTP